MFRSSCVFSAFAVALLSSGSAFASCSAPEKPLILATIPADDAANVATDAHIVVFSDQARRLTVEVNGTPWSQNEFHAFTGQLAPNSTHEVVVTYPVEGGGTVAVDRFTFTTGATTAPAAPPAPNVDAVSVAEQDTCESLARRTGCPDTGRADILTFDVVGDAPGWFVDGRGHPEFQQVWPQSCGAPQWFGYGHEDGCFEVRAFDQNGHVSAPSTVCRGVELDGSNTGSKADDDSAGCSSVRLGDPSWLFLLVAFASRRRTRTRFQRHHRQRVLWG